MGGPVRVNGREVVTSKSGGISFAFGDVCRVPEVGAIPFVNVAVSADAEGTSRTVRVHSVPVMVARSRFGRSTGDEPGADGGVVSGTSRGPAMFSNYSYDVRIEGQNVPRAYDPMLHNLAASGLPNAASPAELQPTGAVDPDFEAVCLAICLCNAAGMKMECFRHMLATPVMDWPARYWDPHNPPGLYVEPSYSMEPPPPEPMLSKTVMSKTMKDAHGNPLPLPGGDRPHVPGSRRPDVVVPLDPTKPPRAGNIKRIYEVKFPGDRLRRHQLNDYGKIAGTAEVEVLDPAKCECSGKRKPREEDVPHEIPDPLPQRGPQEESEREREDVPMPTPEPSLVPLAVAVGLVIVAAAVAGPVGAAAATAVLLYGATKSDEEPEA